MAIPVWKMPRNQQVVSILIVVILLTIIVLAYLEPNDSLQKWQHLAQFSVPGFLLGEVFGMWIGRTNKKDK